MRQAYAPFSRDAAVAVALREWRAWGSPVNDDPPGSRPPLPDSLKPERQEGMWQRVGEYWWVGTDPNRPEAAWTGRHDANGTEFAGSRDAEFAWSAAFMAYVMYSAGAGTRFTPTASHATYINAAVFNPADPVMRAHRIGEYAPQPGDLICYGRASNRPLRLETLSGNSFPSHCDIVVRSQPSSIAVIGGNVNDAVTMKNIPTGPNGLIGGPDGTPIDARYPWFVVLQVLYDR